MRVRMSARVRVGGWEGRPCACVCVCVHACVCACVRYLDVVIVVIVAAVVSLGDHNAWPLGAVYCDLEQHPGGIGLLLLLLRFIPRALRAQPPIFRGDRLERQAKQVVPARKDGMERRVEEGKERRGREGKDRKERNGAQ